MGQQESSTESVARNGDQGMPIRVRQGQEGVGGACLTRGTRKRRCLCLCMDALCIVSEQVQNMATLHHINEVFTRQQGKGKTHRALKSGVSPKTPSSKLVAPQFSGSTELGPQVHQKPRKLYESEVPGPFEDASGAGKRQHALSGKSPIPHPNDISRASWPRVPILKYRKLLVSTAKNSTVRVFRWRTERVLRPSLNDGLDTNLQGQLVNPRAIMMEYRHVAAVQGQIRPKDSDLSDEKFPRLSSPSNRVSWRFTEMIHCAILPLSWTYQ